VDINCCLSVVCQQVRADNTDQRILSAFGLYVPQLLVRSRNLDVSTRTQEGTLHSTAASRV